MTPRRVNNSVMWDCLNIHMIISIKFLKMMELTRFVEDFIHGTNLDQSRDRSIVIKFMGIKIFYQ